METDAGFAATQRWRFRHLFVDEFQDVNPLQFRLLRAWLGDNDDVCVVGDPDQAIYGWNGADAGYLARFTEHFPGAATERLAHNHRSTPQIVAVAGAVLGRAGADRGGGHPDGRVPRVVSHDDEEAEGAALAGWCRVNFHEGVAWSAQAVLVRTNQLARQLAERLRHAGVPARLLLARPRAGQLAALAWVARAAARLDDLAADAAAGDVEDLTAAECAMLAELIGEFRALDPSGSAARFAAWLEGPLSTDGAAGRGHRRHLPRGEGPRMAGGARRRAGGRAGTRRAGDERAGAGRGTAPPPRGPEPGDRASDLLVDAAAAGQRPGAGAEALTSPRGDRPLLPGAGARQPARSARPTARRCWDPLRPRPTRPRATTTPPSQALRDWRRRHARTLAVPEVAVLADDVLSEIARRRPLDVDELAAVQGVGPGRARRLGPALLAQLDSTRDEKPA